MDSFIIIGFMAGVGMAILLRRDKQKNVVNPPKGAPSSEVVVSEADRVRSLVKERIKVAEERGIPKLAIDLDDETKYYPSWIKHTPRDYVPDLILEAAGNSSGSKQHTTTLRFVDGNSMEFRFNQGINVEELQYADLELDWNGSQVMVLSLVRTEGDPRRLVEPAWKLCRVDSYISGEWQERLSDLKNAIQEQASERAKKKHEDPAELAALKKKFGIR